MGEGEYRWEMGWGQTPGGGLNMEEQGSFTCPETVCEKNCEIENIQFSSVAQLCPTLCNPMNRSTPGLPVHHQPWNLLKLKSIESVMPSSHLIFCHPFLLLPSIPPSIRVFSKFLPDARTLHTLIHSIFTTTPQGGISSI